MTGRRSRSSRSASRRFPVTGSLKLMTGHIVLVMSGWRYCGLMSLEQSDPSKIGRATVSTSDANTPRSRSKTKVSTIERMIISKRQEQANGHGIFKRQEQANGHGILCKMSRETRRGTGAW
uniref:Uncharacterized protein n=1 Tax=Triticum urartu TaxID=4572 RepID=A0A8R7QYA8_TRIUA